MVVGKFRVGQNFSPEGFANQRIIRLRAEYDQNLPEDQKYALATPTANMEMVVNNPAVFDQFPLEAPIFCVMMSEEEYRSFEENWMQQSAIGELPADADSQEQPNRA